MNTLHHGVAMCLYRLLFISVFSISVLHAHPAIDSRLQQINRQLSARPDDAELLVTRGNLYLEHGEADKALQDLTRATTREPTLGAAWFSRARIELQLGKPEQAMTSNSLFLKLHSPLSTPPSPAQIGGLFQQGAIYEALGNPTAAASSYQQAVEGNPNATPEQYLLLIDALQNSQQQDAALLTIEVAIQVHGELPQLLETAASIEAERQRPAKALHWLDRLLQQPQRHEYLLLRKARIQRAMGDEAAAQASLEAALQAVNTLPKPRRYSEATLALEQEILTEKAGQPQSARPAGTTSALPDK